MLGASRTSNAALQEYLTSLFSTSNSETSYVEAGRSLFEVVGVIVNERTLRSTLADPSTSAESKRGIVDRLFGGKISDMASDVLRHVVDSRWSSDSDMIDATEEAGATLLLMGAEVAGTIDRVEEELFRFGRSIDANADLQMALTDPATGADLKTGIVRSLLQGKATEETIELVGEVAGKLRGRQIQDAVVRLSELAAGRRGRVIADIRSAIPLNDAQQQRLCDALGKLHGRQVELNIEIDPAVIGGIEVRVGDEVIDGTAATKLEQARRRLAS